LKDRGGVGEKSSFSLLPKFLSPTVKKEALDHLVGSKDGGGGGTGLGTIEEGMGNEEQESAKIKRSPIKQFPPDGGGKFKTGNGAGSKNSVDDPPHRGRDRDRRGVYVPSLAPEKGAHGKDGSLSPFARVGKGRSGSDG